MAQFPRYKKRKPSDSVTTSDLGDKLWSGFPLMGCWHRSRSPSLTSIYAAEPLNLRFLPRLRLDIVAKRVRQSSGNHSGGAFSCAGRMGRMRISLRALMLAVLLIGPAVKYPGVACTLAGVVVAVGFIAAVLTCVDRMIGRRD
jgi:hypothetical protein